MPTKEKPSTKQSSPRAKPKTSVKKSTESSRLSERNGSLTGRQKKFADEYLASGNITDSARKAGYKQPHVQGFQTLDNIRVKEYIKSKAEKLENDNIASIIEVKEFWTKTMRDVETDIKERIKSSELIAKTYGAFLDKIEHSGMVGVQIVDDVK